MNEYIELFIRSIVTGMGSGIGTYFVLKMMMKHLERPKTEVKDDRKM